MGAKLTLEATYEVHEDDDWLGLTDWFDENRFIILYSYVGIKIAKHNTRS